MHHAGFDGRREMSSLSFNRVLVHDSVKSLTMEANLQKGRLFHRVPCAKSREKLQEFFLSVARCFVNNTVMYFNLFACPFKPCNTSVITRVPNFIL